jgi:subfamily B ATP-binding cassette protein MsbA
MNEQPVKSGFWNLLSGLKKYKASVVLSILCNVLLSIFTVVSIPLIIPFFQVLFGSDDPVQKSSPNLYDLPAYLQNFFAEIINNEGKGKALLIVCIATGLIFFLKNLFRYLALYFMAPVRNGIVKDLRHKIFKKLMDLPLGYFTEQKKGDLMTRMSNDVQEVEWSILNMIEVLFKSPLIIAGSIIMMLLISPQLTSFVFILMLFTGIVIGIIGKTLKKKSLRAQQYLSDINSQVEESLTGIKTIKGFGSEQVQINKFKKYNNAYANLMIRLLRRKDLSSPLSEWLGVSVVTVLMWYGSQQVLNNALEPEIFFAFIFAFYQVIEPSKSFSTAYYNIQKGMAAVERIDQLLSEENEERVEKSEEKFAFDNKIEFSDVSFSYLQNDSFGLKNFNLQINKGEKIALVGASGAGKTTIMDLIAGFYSPDSGYVKIDETSSHLLGKESRQKLIGMVAQATFLFNGTIEENLRMGRKELTISELHNAAKIAQIHEFIKQLPGGYSTNVGDNGVKLSGGQRQRLSIARAILSDPPILLLDEATSSLDTQSELLIQKAFDSIFQERTVLVIAHRMSTIRDCDRILVLDDGRIIQEGNHKELINTKGSYKKMIEMQTFAP